MCSSDLDLRREQALAQVTAVSDVDRANAVARIAENGSLIGRVSQCLGVRAEAYRVALERLVIAQPSPMAADADRALTALRRRIAEVAAAPVTPVALVTKP